MLFLSGGEILEMVNILADDR